MNIDHIKTLLLELASSQPEYWKGKGCSDGNCVIYKPEGIHTNGGCKCGTRFANKDWGHNKLQWYNWKIQDIINLIEKE